MTEVVTNGPDGARLILVKRTTRLITAAACAPARSAAEPHAISPVTSVVIPATMADVEEVEVVVAHHERATLRVGDVFL